MVTSSEVVGLVRDEDLGVAGDAYGADDALAHAAAKLMRIVAEADFRSRDAHLAEHVDDLFAQGIALHVCGES